MYVLHILYTYWSKIAEWNAIHSGLDNQNLTSCVKFCCIYIKLIKIKEKQQVGIKGPKFSAIAFLGGLFLTTERG